MKNIKTAALYIRVSTNDQVEYSPDSQIKLCYKYAKEHEIEINPTYIFREDGISGTKADKRPQFQLMISTAKKKPKPFDCILVYDFSRFARNKDESVMYKTLLRKKLDIDVISITQPLSEGKESIILESMYEAMDEYYSLNLAENSIRGKLEKASRGEHQGDAPYGYKYDKNTKTIQVVPEQAEIVKMIYNKWIQPETKLLALCRELNELGIRTKKGKPFENRTIKWILHNPAYIGYSWFRKGGIQRKWYADDIIKVKAKHEPILTEEIWNKAQEKNKLHEEKFKNSIHEEPLHDNIFRGILVCKDCGKTLSRCEVKNRRSYFQCNSYRNGTCTNHYLREDVLYDVVLKELKKTFTEKLDITISATNSNSDTKIQEIKSLELLIEKNKKKLDRAKDLYLNEIDTIEEYKKNKTELEKEINTINKKIIKLKSDNKYEDKKEQIYKLCSTAYDIINDQNVDFKIKNEITHTLFDKIVYSRDENTLEIYYK